MRKDWNHYFCSMKYHYSEIIGLKVVHYEEKSETWILVNKSGKAHPFTFKLNRHYSLGNMCTVNWSPATDSIVGRDMGIRL